MSTNRNFGLVGYDKDNDVFDDLMLDTEEKCLEAIEILKPLVSKNRLLSSYGEPYDRFAIWDYNKNECVQVVDI